MLVDRAGSVLALARDAKVSDSSIHLWLAGSEPSREKLVRLAQASNVTVDCEIEHTDVLEGSMVKMTVSPEVAVAATV